VPKLPFKQYATNCCLYYSTHTIHLPSPCRGCRRLQVQRPARCGVRPITSRVAYRRSWRSWQGSLHCTSAITSSVWLDYNRYIGFGKWPQLSAAHAAAIATYAACQALTLAQDAMQMVVHVRLISGSYNRVTLRNSSRVAPLTRQHPHSVHHHRTH
jgi:hypothetical protein